jgi:FAD-dependent oxidoreductase family protein
MVSEVVMTESYVMAREVAGDPVGMGAYGMDSHNVQRYITAGGYVRNEGNVQVHGFKPYLVSHRSIVPQRGQGYNLLVPVCLSASHIAYGSIRIRARIHDPGGNPRRRRPSRRSKTRRLFRK